MAETSPNYLLIDEKENLILNGTELKGVTEYRLKHSAGDGEAAELTVTMNVSIGRGEI